MDYAGLIYDDSSHYLDHLAPFCAHLHWPLIICEPALAELARNYYPDLEVIETSLWDLQLPRHVVTCDNRPLLHAAFPHQSCKVLWLPHGNSDKGSFFKGLGDIAFVYGEQMNQQVHAPHVLRVGNFRFAYFLKHQKFYQKIIHLPRGKNILYAPTWDDSANNCSFWKAFPQLANHLPKDCNLLVKLHPNTLRKFAVELEILMGRYAKKGIYFLPEIPPVYPILSGSDAYIGDMSSIGYDFLTFDRPLYFLNANRKLPLHACGAAIEPETFRLGAGLFSEKRKALYTHTFDPTPDWDQLKEQIEGLKTCPLQR